MAKRGKLEITYNILQIIKNNRGKIKSTPLLRKTNISSLRFKEYFNALEKKGFIIRTTNKEGKFISLTSKGTRFLEKYQTIINFIEEFEM